MRLHVPVGSMFFEGLMTGSPILKAPPHVAKNKDAAFFSLNLENTTAILCSPQYPIMHCKLFSPRLECSQGPLLYAIAPSLSPFMSALYCVPSYTR